MHFNVPPTASTNLVPANNSVTEDPTPVFYATYNDSVHGPQDNGDWAYGDWGWNEYEIWNSAGTQILATGHGAQGPPETTSNWRAEEGNEMGSGGLGETDTWTLSTSYIPDGTYKWRVRGWDEIVHGPWSSLRTLTVDAPLIDLRSDCHIEAVPSRLSTLKMTWPTPQRRRGSRPP